MEREDNSVMEEKKNEKLIIEDKFNRNLLLLLLQTRGRRSGGGGGGGGRASTPSPKWRLDDFSSPQTDNNNNMNPSSNISARKLCATLWEMDAHHLTDKMPHRDVNPPLKDKPSFHSPLHQPSVAGSMRRHAQVSSKQRVDKNPPAASPPCYTSSTEVASYSPVITPTSSLDLKGRKPDTRNNNLKTSTELLKVLNRIWTLEEQHVSNMSLMKALKIELDRSHSRFKQLLEEKKMDRREMDELMNKVSQDKHARKSKEHDRIKAAVQSVRDELEDEKKLRKRSESLHRKLAGELSEIKSSFSNALKELERERNARVMLENLCDEFAKGVRDYEQEVRNLKHKPEIERTSVGRKSATKLILHISEAWLDERMQTNGLSEKNRTADRLSFDIETFLQATHSSGLKKKSYSRRHSLESFPLHEAASAPQRAADDDNSSDSDSQCFELNKNTGIKHNASECNGEEIKNSNSIKKKTVIREIPKTCNLATCQGQDEELNDNQGEKSRENEVLSTYAKASGVCSLNANHGLNNSVRTNSPSSEGEKIHPEIECKDDFRTPGAFPGHASPVQRWNSKLVSPDFEKTEKSPLHLKEKENSLKAKLLEARLEGRQSRSRASKGSS
ncbi:hypothetical protein ACFE04_026348 [Oxalis oulophora]